MKGLATGVPRYKVTQRDALKIALKAENCSTLTNVLERVYSNTKIQTRYMAIPGQITTFFILFYLKNDQD